MNSLEWLNSVFIKKSQVANELFDAKTKAEQAKSRAYLNNKLNNVDGKKFSEEELKKLDEIRKKIIQTLV